MENTKKMSMLLLALMAPTALDAGRVNLKKKEVSTGEQVALALANAGLDVGKAVIDAGVTVGVNAATAALQSELDKKANVEGKEMATETRESLKNMITDSAAVLHETVLGLTNHAHELGKTAIQEGLGDISPEDLESEKLATAAKLVEFTSGQAAKLTKSTLGHAANISLTEINKAAEKQNNESLKDIAKVGGAAVSSIINTIGNTGSQVLTIAGDEEYNRLGELANAMDDKAEELYGPKTSSASTAQETIANAKNIVQSVADIEAVKVNLEKAEAALIDQLS